MDIGTKLKNARNEAGITQEHAAEVLGVSRQTISNWENEKTYPDIVSVIRMSELYSVSIDRLLKGKENEDMKEYIEYLGESTNTVLSKTKLSKLILILTYLVIWTVGVILFWCFVGTIDAMSYSIAFLYIALPAAELIISFIIEKNKFWGKYGRFGILIFGFAYMLAEYVTFSLSNMLLNFYSHSILLPNIAMLFIGMLISSFGYCIAHFAKRNIHVN